MAWQDYNPGNSSNPLDEIGTMHNEGLDHFINNVDSLNLSNVPLNGKDLFATSKLLAEFYAGNYGNMNDAVVRTLCFNNATTGTVSFYNDGSPKPYPNRQEMYSPDTNTFIDDVKNEVSILTTDNIQTYLTNIRNIESNIGSTYNLADNETRVAYVLGSIARYSGAYAVDQFIKHDNNNSPWAQKSNDLGADWGPEYKPPDWVYSDLNAGIVGGYVGAVATTLAPATSGASLGFYAAGIAGSSALSALTGGLF